MIEFQEWPKIPRLNRDIVITEKIDGTNAGVGIVLEQDPEHSVMPANCLVSVNMDGVLYHVYAQSRTRIISLTDDNYGFARWVYENAVELIQDLGPGLHFGEWWGSGVQRGYGLNEKRFSLFNTVRHGGKQFQTPGVATTPVLYQGPFSSEAIQEAQDLLRRAGSVAAPGFERPEGIVIYHTAANHCFKVTLEKDEVPKEAAKQEPRQRRQKGPRRGSDARTDNPELYLAFVEGRQDALRPEGSEGAGLAWNAVGVVG